MFRNINELQKSSKMAFFLPKAKVGQFYRILSGFAKFKM